MEKAFFLSLQLLKIFTKRSTTRLKLLRFPSNSYTKSFKQIPATSGVTRYSLVENCKESEENTGFLHSG